MRSSDNDPSQADLARAPHPALPSDLALDAKAALAGWIGALGLQVTGATQQEVVAAWTVDERHLQPHGIVHGGVYCSVIETCCSIGAGLSVPAGMLVVGVENHTSFLRPVRAGRLLARARPLHAGRRAQLWECEIVDTSQRLIATGRVRLMNVEADAGGER
jgi:uncharacterized protein (TIGR00369 family)